MLYTKTFLAKSLNLYKKIEKQNILNEKQNIYLFINLNVNKIV